MTLLEAAKQVQTGEITSLELVNQSLVVAQNRAELNALAFLAEDKFQI